MGLNVSGMNCRWKISQFLLENTTPCGQFSGKVEVVSGIRVWEALKEKKRKRGLGVAFREPLRVNEQDLDEVREFEYMRSKLGYTWREAEEGPLTPVIELWRTV